MLRRHGLQELAVVVDDDLDRQIAQRRLVLRQIAPVRLHVHLPAELRDAPGDLGNVVPLHERAARSSSLPHVGRPHEPAS